MTMHTWSYLYVNNVVADYSILRQVLRKNVLSFRELSGLLQSRDRNDLLAQRVPVKPGYGAAHIDVNVSMKVE